MANKNTILIIGSIVGAAAVLGGIFWYYGPRQSSTSDSSTGGRGGEEEESDRFSGQWQLRLEELTGSGSAMDRPLTFTYTRADGGVTFDLSSSAEQSVSGSGMENMTWRGTFPGITGLGGSVEATVEMTGRVEGDQFVFQILASSANCPAQGTSSGATLQLDVCAMNLGGVEHGGTITLADGAEAVVNYTKEINGATVNISEKWSLTRLSGSREERVEQWTVMFKNDDAWTRGFGSWAHEGRSGSIGAGLRVYWTVIANVDVGETSCNGTANIVLDRVEAISDPANVFGVSSEVNKTGSAPVRCRRAGDEISLAFPIGEEPGPEGGWGYWWRYDFKVLPGAVTAMADAGLPPSAIQDVMAGLANMNCQKRGEGEFFCVGMAFPEGTDPEKYDVGAISVPSRADPYWLQLRPGDQSGAGILGEKITVMTR